MGKSKNTKELSLKLPLSYFSYLYISSSPDCISCVSGALITKKCGKSVTGWHFDVCLFHTHLTPGRVLRHCDCSVKLPHFPGVYLYLQYSHIQRSQTQGEKSRFHAMEMKYLRNIAVNSIKDRISNYLI
jgi:hypothetical protein